LKSKLGQEQENGIDYWQLFQELPLPCLLFKADDPKFTIVDLNSAREKIEKWPREFYIGKPLHDVFPVNKDELHHKKIDTLLLSAIREVIKTGKPKHFRLPPFREKGERGWEAIRHIERSYVPIKDAQGKVTHIVSTTRDITNELNEAERIAEIQERLEEAMSISKVGSWTWDITNGTIVTDKNLKKILPFDDADTSAGNVLEQFVRLVHPDDLPRVRRAIQRTIKQHVPYEEEYRVVLKGGRVRWMLARGKVEKRGDKLLFPGVIVDISERRNLQAQVELARQQDKLNRQTSKILQERNEQLEAIGRSKDEFVALASHQLRTPATAVKQYLGMVLQGYVGEVSDLQEDMLSKAFDSNERQIQIINQILNAARVDTGRLVLTPMPVDIRSLLQGIVTDMKSMFESHQHTLQVSLPKAPVRVPADTGYLRMAIENIVNNAIVYTPNGGEITLKLMRAGKRCKLIIADTGVGIRKQDLSKLFIKFSRIHNPLSVQAGGSGIGLYLASEIVRLHSGEVSVNSAVGKGTSFAISLPLAQNTT